MTLVSRFARDEHGAVTIDFVTIFPAFILMMLFFADASVLYLTYTELFNVSRDAARRVAVGALHVDDVPAYISQRANLGARTYTVASYEGNQAVVEMSVGVGDAAIFGVMSPILGETLAVQIRMFREPTPPPTSFSTDVEVAPL